MYKNVEKIQLPFYFIHIGELALILEYFRVLILLWSWADNYVRFSPNFCLQIHFDNAQVLALLW